MRVWTAIFVILLASLTLAEESSILDGATVTNVYNADNILDPSDFGRAFTPDPNVLIGVGFKTLVITNHLDGYHTD